MLTIAICTHDRAADLRVCLEHLHSQVDFRHAELLVIDSASSPEQVRAIELDMVRWPGARLIRQAEPGLSRARNAALAAARGDWLAFLDDDAIPDGQWFAQATRLAAIAPEACAMIGGDVAPAFPQGTQPRLGRRWRQLLSLVEQPDEAFTTGPVSICGANVLFRTSFLHACGGFPESLGRIGSNLLSGEEKLVQEIAVLHGRPCGRSNLLRARHRIPAERLKRAWATRRAYWDGRSDERLRAILGQRIAGSAVLGLCARVCVLAALYPFAPTRQEFFLRFWYALGRVHEWIGQSRASDPAATDAARLHVARADAAGMRR